MKNHCGALLGTTYVTVPSDLLTPLRHPEPLHGNVRFVKQPLFPRLQTAHKFFSCIPTPHKATMSIFYSFRLIFYFLEKKSAKKAKSWPNVTNVANFTENRSNLTRTPSISIPSCHKKLGRVRARQKNFMCNRAPTVYPPRR